MRKNNTLMYVCLQCIVILLLIMISLYDIQKIELKTVYDNKTNVTLNFSFDKSEEFQHAYIRIYAANQYVAQIKNGDNETIKVSLPNKKNSIIVECSEDCRGVESIEIDVNPRVINEYDIDLSLYSERIILYRCFKC